MAERPSSTDDEFEILSKFSNIDLDDQQKSMNNSNGKSSDSSKDDKFEELCFQGSKDDDKFLLTNNLRSKILYHLFDLSKLLLNKRNQTGFKNNDLINLILDLKPIKSDNFLMNASTESTTTNVKKVNNQKDASKKITVSNLLKNVIPNTRKLCNLTDARKEGSFTIKIDNLKKFLNGNDSRVGDVFIVANLNWYILVESKIVKEMISSLGETITASFISFYLFCQPNEPNFRYLQTKLTFRMINQVNESFDLTRTSNHNFKPNGRFGYPAFAYFEDFENENKNFVKNDAIYLEITIEVY